MKWSKLQGDVYDWSHANFGDQDWVNPLLGLAEEVSELARAPHDDARLDALADTMIFLADFCGRFGVNLQGVMDEYEKFAAHDWSGDDILTPMTDSIYHMFIAIGEIHHGCLKTLQGIRGDEDHMQTVRKGIFRLVRHATIASYQIGEPLDLVTERVWNQTVSKRKWNAAS